MSVAKSEADLSVRQQFAKIQGTLEERPLEVIKEFQEQSKSTYKEYVRSNNLTILVAYSIASKAKNDLKFWKALIKDRFFRKFVREQKRSRVLRSAMLLAMNGTPGSANYKQACNNVIGLKEMFERQESVEVIAELLDKKGIDRLYREARIEKKALESMDSQGEPQLEKDPEDEPKGAKHVIKTPSAQAVPLIRPAVIKSLNNDKLIAPSTSADKRAIDSCKPRTWPDSEHAMLGVELTDKIKQQALTSVKKPRTAILQIEYSPHAGGWQRIQATKFRVKRWY